MKNLDLPTLLIRLTLGTIFFIHGLKKVKEMEATIHHFYVDYGLPSSITYLVTAIEVLGGALLLVGMLTRMVSLGIVVVMVGAIVTVTWEKGFIHGYEFNLALLAMALSLFFGKATRS